MDNGFTELRVRLVPDKLHERMEKYRRRLAVKHDKDFNKGEIVLELLDQALKTHKL